MYFVLSGQNYARWSISNINALHYSDGVLEKDSVHKILYFFFPLENRMFAYLPLDLMKNG